MADKRPFITSWHSAYFVSVAIWKVVFVLGWQRWDYEHVWEMLRYESPVKIVRRRGR